MTKTNRSSSDYRESPVSDSQGLCGRPSSAEREHDLSIASRRAESASINAPPLSESVCQKPAMGANPTTDKGELLQLQGTQDPALHLDDYQHTLNHEASRGEKVPKGLQAWVRALSATSGLAEDGRTLPQRLPELAERFGARPALDSEVGSLTYAGPAERSNQYGHWAQQQGVAHGEVVCLLMPNCAEYVAIWLGISGIGGVVALLNTGLRHEALIRRGSENVISR